MREPRNLEVTDLSLNLAELVYRVTKGFPLDERFGLVAQMRRAAVSVGSNISEGCGRSTDRAFANYIENALSEVLEVDFQAQVALRLGHGDPGLLQELRGGTDQLKRMLASLSAAVRRKKATAPPGRPPPPAAS
jgi:four helix bundle protein